MPPHPLSVVRSASRLRCLVHETRGPTDAAAPWAVEHATELRPFETRSNPRLWTAWCALEEVTAWDRETLAHVLVVLDESVPDSGDADGTLPALGPFVLPPEPPRATAAHPRAYRGTKHRPPRPRQPEAIDVRPYLLEQRHIDQVLALLEHPARDRGPRFDPWFAMYVEPLLRACAPAEVRAFAALGRTLQLHTDHALRDALIAVFFAAGAPSRALAWWIQIQSLAPELRLDAARRIAASTIAAVELSDAANLATVVALDPVRQWSIFGALARGATWRYIASGLELDAIRRDRVEELPAGQDDVTAIVIDTIDRIGHVMDEDSGAEFWRGHIWVLCGHHRELAGVLASPALARITPKAAFTLLRLTSSVRWEPESATRHWPELARITPLLADFASNVPPSHQRRFVDDAVGIVWWAMWRELNFTDVLAHAISICVALARPPFATQSHLATVLASMEVPFGADNDALVGAPEASWLALERACERDNAETMIARGMRPLAQRVPGLLTTAFAIAPGALIATADSLASLSLEAAVEIVESFATSPLADARLADADLERLCETIAPVSRAGGPDPVRRALRRHLAGEVTLSDAQLRGHRARIVEALPVVRLASIRQAVERALAARLDVARIESSSQRHAAAMLGDAEKQRRQLRRLLVAHAKGDSDWRLRHPLTEAWFARHPRLDRERWLAGIEQTLELPGVGPVRVAVERDALEALKLGTYVGSCLGRGGNFAYSAAAVVLDANKHVVYARDRRGSVVGRQLVAISEADELVCFWVYGAAPAAHLAPIFRAFDQALADTLGVPVYFENDEGYEIANILSIDWYSDMAVGLPA